MSIKDLFTKSNKILSSEDIEALGEEVESPKLIKEKSTFLIDLNRMLIMQRPATLLFMVLRNSTRQIPFREFITHIRMMVP